MKNTLSKIRHAVAAYLLLALTALLYSCGPKDNPNALQDTIFPVEVNDSTHILSAPTYSYLHNLSAPLGIKVVVATVNDIPESEIGTYADNVFNEYCKKPYSGNTFKQRGVLVLVSDNPKLVQVRVGKTYEVYCRMRGSAAGKDYLEIQQAIAQKGVDEMCPVALNNALQDITDCRQLPWYKKAALKISFMHVKMMMDDVATPSKSFFSQFYFKPFLYIVGGVKKLVGSWLLAFLFIAVVYILVKGWIEKKLNAYIEKKAKENSSSDEQFYQNFETYQLIKALFVFIVKLIITIPTLAAISVLSTSRMEDILALQYAHIPSVEAWASYTGWTNQSPALWFVLLMLIVYYLKFLLSVPSYFTYAHLPNSIQVGIYQQRNRFRYYLDIFIKEGINRKQISALFGKLFYVVINAITHDNAQEITEPDVDINNYDTDEEGKKKGNLIDVFFLGNDDFNNYAPGLAFLINTHREALFLAFFFGLAIIALFSYPYALYFLILWSVTLIYRIVNEVKKAHVSFKSVIHKIEPMKLLREVWPAIITFLVMMSLCFLVLAPSYSQRTVASIDVSQSLPADFSGLYFVTKAEGAAVSGVTARILKDNDDHYYMQVYSDDLTRRFEMELDEKLGVFHSDVLGDGYIKYDSKLKSIEINFSDIWILTN